MIAFSKSLRAALELLYEDECEIWRSEEVTKPNGSTLCQFVQKYIGIPCRLSRMTSRRSMFQQDPPQTAIQCDARLYCHGERDILEGDCAKIVHLGETLEYNVLDVFCYASHKECTLKKVVEA
jgi:hypothetical protein